MEALIIIDMQKGFFKNILGKRNNLQAENNILRILENFRKENKEIIHIQHLSTDEKGILFSNEDRKFLKGFEPLSDEIVFQKHVNSAFIGTNLENYLRNKSIDKLIIVGMTLPHCVSTTVRMAANLGFKVILIEDATITFEIADYFSDKLLSVDEIHKYHISALNEEFCDTLSTKNFLNL